MSRRLQSIVIGTATAICLFVANAGWAQNAPHLSVGPSASTNTSATTASGTGGTPETVPADAADQREPREWFGSGRRWVSWSRMTGDWGSWRRTLESGGLSVSASTTADASHAAPGAAGSVLANRALMDVGVDLDLARAGLGAGHVFVGYQTKGGGDGWACVDEAQGFSNIDAPDFRRVVEVYYERSFGDRVRLKAGLNDANAEFAFVENGGEFINSSMGFSPSIFVMPTYPDPQLGIILQTRPTSWSYAGAGIYDGGPALGSGRFDAVFAIGEAGLRWDRWGGGRVGLGYWHTRGAMQTEEGEIGRMKTSGQYAVIDQTLWTDGRTEHPRRVAAFLQAGFAAAAVSPVSRHLGAGVVATGLVPHRPDDAIGVGVTSVRFGQASDCPNAVVLAGEANVGAFYKLALTGWLSLKPDVQVIVNPAGRRDGRTAVVGTVRVEIGF